MKNILNKIFPTNKPVARKSSKFSTFFRESSSTQKKKLFEEAAKAANKEQSEMVKRAKMLAN